MPLQPFKTSAPLTMGVELELQLLNSTDYDLSPLADDLLEILKQRAHPGEIKHEITQSMVEVSTSVQKEYLPLLFVPFSHKCISQACLYLSCFIFRI